MRSTNIVQFLDSTISVRCLAYIFLVLPCLLQATPLPTVLSFEIHPTTVENIRDEWIEFSWQTKDADRVRLYHNGREVKGRSQLPNGELGFPTSLAGGFKSQHSKLATYELVAENNQGKASKSIVVPAIGVKPPSSSLPEIISFRALPSPVEVGKNVRFYWEVKGADSVRFYDDHGEIEGRIQLGNGTFGWPLTMPGAFMTSEKKTTTYKLVAENREGKKTIKTFLVRVKNHQLVPLKSYWSAQRGDNLTCGTTACREAQKNTGGYHYLRVEGCAFKVRKKGTIPLVLYWHSTRKDNSTVASAQSRAEHVNTKGNRLVRTEGYIYKHQQPGTIPLKLYWFPKRTDNATVAAARSIAAQEKTKGMRYIRTEGYIYPASNCR